MSNLDPAAALAAIPVADETKPAEITEAASEVDVEAAKQFHDEHAAEHTPAAVNETGPTAGDLDAAAAEEAIAHQTAAPPSQENTTSHVDGVKGGPLNPSLNSDLFGSDNKPKFGDVTDPNGLTHAEPLKEAEPVGPRGTGIPGDVMTDADRQKVADKIENRLRQGMSSTDHVDSRGEPQGHFEVKPMGHDAMGAKIPDVVDTSKLVEAQPALVGPRGAGAPPDTFHGARPAKR